MCVRGSSSALGQLSAGDGDGARPVHRQGRPNLVYLIPDFVRVPFGVEVTYVGPATTTLMFERSIAKTVPVVPSIEGQPSPGYAVERVVTDPTEVEVLGPESALRDLQQATTAPVQLDGATGSIRESVTIGTPNSAARLRTPRSAQVLVEIAPVRTERTLIAVPVRMQNLRAGQSAQSTPSTVSVTVRGAEDALKELKADDIEASVDLAVLGPGRYPLAIRVSPSRTFPVARLDPAQVTIHLR